MALNPLQLIHSNVWQQFNNHTLHIIVMKKTYILILVLNVLLFQKFRAQSNFQDGFILISQSDTLYGKIDNKDYYNNSQFCDFKSKKNDSIIRFYPDKIFGYRFINGKYYISKNIEIDKKPSNIFMEFLIKGKLNVYFLQDKKGMNHYYISKDTIPLHELIFEDSKEVNGNRVSYESKQYIAMLKFYTSDCPAIENDILKLNEPKHNNLIKIAKKYNDLACDSNKCIIYEKKLPNKVKLYLDVGTNIVFLYTSYICQSYGFNLLFQMTQRSELLYLGLGINDWNKNVQYLVPFSINYLNPRLGISPIVSYEFILNSFGGAEALKFGLNYQMRKISFSLLVVLNTVIVVVPYGSSLNFGIMYDLR